MLARDPGAAHRAASPLELLFDLVFVVAISQASSELAHLIADDHVGQGVVGYLIVFFSVWWAWMNYTWFASVFDTDDWYYRLLTIVQMAGVLVLAAGVHDAMVDFDLDTATWGYVIMRLAMVAQWVRAAKSDPTARAMALRSAIGIGAVQVLWLARLLLDPQLQFATIFLLMAAELSVPIWADARGRRAAWHPRHIAERFGLFTLLLLGESLLASANAMFDALREGEHVPELLLLSAAGIVMTAGIWWIYFAREHHDDLVGRWAGFRFGYAHYALFAAVGAVSSGVEVQIAALTGHAHVPHLVVALALTVPVAAFLLSAWAVLLRGHVPPGVSIVAVGAAAVVVASAWLPAGESVVAALALVAVVVALEMDAARSGSALQRQ